MIRVSSVSTGGFGADGIDDGEGVLAQFGDFLEIFGLRLQEVFQA